MPCGASTLAISRDRPPSLRSAGQAAALVSLPEVPGQHSDRTTAGPAKYTWERGTNRPGTANAISRLSGAQLE
eukprot:5365797-Alexandrium_andersonii.AAC.1